MFKKYRKIAQLKRIHKHLVEQRYELFALAEASKTLHSRAESRGWTDAMEKYDNYYDRYTLEGTLCVVAAYDISDRIEDLKRKK